VGTAQEVSEDHVSVFAPAIPCPISLSRQVVVVYRDDGELKKGAKLGFAIHRGSVAAYVSLCSATVAIYLLFLALGLSACSRLEDLSAAPTSAGAQAGLETTLGSDNAPLIAEALLQVMDLPGYARTDIETLVERLRATPSGRASIERGIRTLVSALDTAPVEPNLGMNSSFEMNDMMGMDPPELSSSRSRGAMLTALAALAPHGDQQAIFLSEFDKLLAGQPSALDSMSRRSALGIAAFLYELRPEQRGIFMDRATGNASRHLLFAAVRLRARLRPAPLHQAVNRILRETEASGRSSDRSELLTSLGFALRLLDLEGDAPADQAAATFALARARAALALGETEQAIAALRDLAAAPADATSYAEWFDVAVPIVDEYRARQGELRILAEHMIPQDGAAPYFSALARFGGNSHAAEAERVLRTAPDPPGMFTGPNERLESERSFRDITRVDGTLRYLDQAGRAMQAVGALCDSAWGRAPFERGSDPFLSWSTLVANLPADQATSIIRERLALEPSRARSRCIVTVAALQARADKPEARQALAAALGRGPSRVSGSTMQWWMSRPGWTSNACRTTADAFTRSSEITKIPAERLLDFTLACPIGSYNSAYGGTGRLAALLHMPTRQQFLDLQNIDQAAFLDDRDKTSLLANKLFSALVDDTKARRQSDYSRLLSPLMFGSGQWNEAGIGDIYTFAAHLILMAGDEDGAATWVITRMDDYGGTTGNALAGTF
jgi:hypothetical protein